MNSYVENHVLLTIQQLIDRNSCGIDGFFTDSKTAATDIMKYLIAQNMLVKNEAVIEIDFDNKSKAA